MTLFEALTGGVFDRLNNIAGNWTKVFQKSQMPRGLPGGGGGGRLAVLASTGPFSGKSGLPQLDILFLNETYDSQYVIFSGWLLYFP